MNFSIPERFSHPDRNRNFLVTMNCWRWQHEVLQQPAGQRESSPRQKASAGQPDPAQQRGPITRPSKAA